MWLGSPVGIRVSATSSPPSGLQPHWLSLPTLSEQTCLLGAMEAPTALASCSLTRLQSWDGDQGWGSGGPSANVPSSSLQAVELPDSFSPELRSPAGGAAAEGCQPEARLPGLRCGVLGPECIPPRPSRPAG